MSGMLMSMRITSGLCTSASFTASRPSAASPTSSIRSSPERIASSASAKSRWSSAMSTLTPISPHTLRCYGRFVKRDEARTKIQKLLITGDNRLKQGVDPEKARESWEQALEVAREAGLEESVRPLVEVRLADLPPRG